MKFPELKNPETLEKHYVGKMSKNSISLMAGMLEMDPKQRFTAIDALEHSYFDTVRDEEIENVIKSNKDKIINQTQLSNPITDQSRTKEVSRRKTSQEKHITKQQMKKNPYSLPLGASPQQFKKKKASHKMYKDKKSSSSIKNLLQGRSSSKEVNNKKN